MEVLSVRVRGGVDGRGQDGHGAGRVPATWSALAVVCGTDVPGAGGPVFSEVTVGCAIPPVIG